MAQLRSSIFISQLQAQTHALLCTQLRGNWPRQRMAVQILDITPSTDIELLTSHLTKTEDIQPGLSAVEATFGFMEFHSNNPESVKSAAASALAQANLSEKDMPPSSIVASHIIDRVEPSHALNINKVANGSPVLANQALFILQTSPATVALLAANEAEKAADIQIVSLTFTGARGRLYISGSANDVRSAALAAEAVLGA